MLSGYAALKLGPDYGGIALPAMLGVDARRSIEVRYRTILRSKCYLDSERL